MTGRDHELLKWAAKSAGKDILEGRDVTGLHPAANILAAPYWNPLTDDGDALRLAVDLGLSVYPIARTESGQACSAVGSGSQVRLSEVIDPSDVRAATRRAIVSAAAEIGRTMT